MANNVDSKKAVHKNITEIEKTQLEIEKIKIDQGVKLTKIKERPGSNTVYISNKYAPTSIKANNFEPTASDIDGLTNDASGRIQASREMYYLNEDITLTHDGSVMPKKQILAITDPIKSQSDSNKSTSETNAAAIANLKNEPVAETNKNNTFDNGTTQRMDKLVANEVKCAKVPVQLDDVANKKYADDISNGKAPLSHTHTEADVSGLTTHLNNRLSNLGGTHSVGNTLGYTLRNTGGDIGLDANDEIGFYSSGSLIANIKSTSMELHKSLNMRGENILNAVDIYTTGNAKMIGFDSGYIDMSGEIRMEDNKISGLATPTDDKDAATKKYVDDNAGSSGYTTGTHNITGTGDYIIVNPSGHFQIKNNNADKEIKFRVGTLADQMRVNEDFVQIAKPLKMSGSSAKIQYAYYHANKVDTDGAQMKDVYLGDKILWSGALKGGNSVGIDATDAECVGVGVHWKVDTVDGTTGYYRVMFEDIRGEYRGSDFRAAAGRDYAGEITNFFSASSVNTAQDAFTHKSVGFTTVSSSTGISKSLENNNDGYIITKITELRGY